MEVHVYTFEDESGAEDSYTTQDYQEADQRAREYHLRVIDHTYTWEDSEIAADYTGGTD